MCIKCTSATLDLLGHILHLQVTVVIIHLLIINIGAAALAN